MSGYGTYSDDYYNTLTLTTEMDLPTGRESLMHYFEQLQKCHPSMKHFYGRDDNEYILEEEKDSGSYRWSSVEAKRISSGYVNPATIDDAIAQHVKVLEIVPFALAVSPLDCSIMQVTFGFDFAYRGNHHELVADTLGVPPMFARLRENFGEKLVCYEPFMQFALDPECRIQARLSIEPRTNAFQIRTGEYPEEQLSVFLAVRRYGSLDTNKSLVATMHELMAHARDVIDGFVIDNVLLPLQQAISIN
ncbi:MAG TPA: hypothetical protein PKD64_04625 [Pirellulaceae bacterium]|nr:hypothetical protein [Pirellulaceae bacterium]HMO91458.1 hypothetical protein [Pirellulaceae bacterium]HMP69465.1 hypothetical protein [Pirellulaceae bacterium]